MGQSFRALRNTHSWLMPHRRSRSTMAGILALPRDVPCAQQQR